VLKDLYDSPIKIQLFNNWSKQVVARVRGERNHPSVMIWSLENEVLFINCINLYGGYMDQFEEEITKCSDAVMALDPTRPTMVDGGGATKANTLPVHGDHYVTAAPNLYPPFAYETNTKGGGRGRWEWDEKRPRFIGEDYYMTGLHPEVSYFQGDSAFTGKPVVGVGIWNRILQEGYRWSGQCAWHYWLSQYDTHQDQYTAYAARAVFSKQWNWTFGAGETATRTFGVFNDSRYADPITFTWTLMVDGKKAASGSHKLTIEPGARKDVEESIKMPSIRGARQEAELVLSLAVNGKEVFNEAKAVSILAPQKRAMPGVGKADLVVFDPEGGASKFLAAQKVDFTPVKSLDALPANWKVLLVGSNALDAPESASSRLAALAATGRRVIVLDQENPLRHQGLPAEMAVTTGVGYSMFGQNFTSTVGYTAFLEDTSHPALAGLADKDFFAWVDFESPVYRNIYDKPVRGARSLVQCHHHLRHTALAEIPVGEGLLMACQLNLSARFAENIVARQLVLNLLGHAATYKLEYYPVTACLDGAPLLKAALDTMGLQYNTAADPVAALGQKTPSILVVNASPETLAKLAANLTAVKKFNDGGGSLVLCGVTPEGLADYNKIVGVDHVMRPFQRERVLLPALRSRLTAGLTSSDVALFSSQRIFNWTEGNYVASDVFSHVVDYDEVAPFGTSSFGSYANIVNGFIGADGWPLIINFQKNADDSPYQVPITFPKEYEFNEFTWVGNTFYSPQTRVNLVFGGDRANMLSWPTAPNAEAQTFAIDPPRKASEVTLEIAEWLPVQGKENTIGIDNIALKVKRPADFYNTVKPLVNIGGLMEYEKGKGRVVLCNLLFQENEAVPENAGKKRRILSTMLHNMKAPFASGKTVIAGMNLKYAPVDISTKSTQYRDEKGWFGDRARTFKDFPPGRQRLAGVPVDIYEFATSPVPNALMLKGANIPGDLPAEITGIPVNQKADALFLLQAARVDRRRNPNEAKAGTWFELAKYVVRYVDGETVEIPVMAERDIDNYSQQNPAAVPGAQVAWTKKFDGNDDSAVAYLMQWTNPRPDVAIATLDLLPGKDNAGVPVLIALTAALVE
ncbi:MAG: hypothetical protein FWF96_05150, partial [Kiritimatiellaeota bacterium]|nr:hypothetical protein [Kiritimatiellota bacterium]